MQTTKLGMAQKPSLQRSVTQQCKVNFSARSMACKSAIVPCARRSAFVVRASAGVAHPGEESQGSYINKQFSPFMGVPNVTMAKGGGMGASQTLERQPLQFVMPTPTVQGPKLDDGGSGGDIGKHNHNGGGGGDDGGDDDDYFGGEDDGEGGDGEGQKGEGFLRTAIPEAYDAFSIGAVFSEWMRTVSDLPFIIRRAVEMGLFSSAQLVRFFSMDVRPGVARSVTRNLPPTMLDGLPNCVFDSSGPLRHYTKQARVGSFFAKVAELSAVGALTGAVASLASTATVQLRQKMDPSFEPSTPVPSIGRSSGGLATFFATNANIRYQLIGGLDRYLFSHSNFLWTYLGITGAARLASISVGELSRPWWQGLPHPGQSVHRVRTKRVSKKVHKRVPKAAAAAAQVEAGAAPAAAAAAVVAEQAFSAESRPLEMEVQPLSVADVSPASMDSHVTAPHPASLGSEMAASLAPSAVLLEAEQSHSGQSLQSQVA